MFDLIYPDVSTLGFFYAIHKLLITFFCTFKKKGVTMHYLITIKN